MKNPSKTPQQGSSAKPVEGLKLEAALSAVPAPICPYDEAQCEYPRCLSADPECVKRRGAAPARDGVRPTRDSSVELIRNKGGDVVGAQIKLWGVEIGYYGCETYLGKAAIRAAKEQADGQ